MATLTIGLVVSAGIAAGATSDTGTVSADVGQLVEISATDSSISAYTEFTPTSGQETLRFSTSDFLRFSNAKSNIQSLWSYDISVSFTQDSTGATSTTTVAYQGTTTTLSDLVYIAQSASGSFLPWELTGSDLTGEAGWTKHADCASVTYQGSFSIPYYSSTGVAQSALTRYYQVCDTPAEIYVGAGKDLSGVNSDSANLYTAAVSGASATEANYETTIESTDYVFYSAGTATTVKIRQGQHVDLSTSSVTKDAYLLLKFPDGFPAGSFATTLTASASDIVS